MLLMVRIIKLYKLNTHPKGCLKWQNVSKNKEDENQKEVIKLLKMQNSAIRSRNAFSRTRIRRDHCEKGAGLEVSIMAELPFYNTLLFVVGGIG